MITVFKRAKTFHALDRQATVIGKKADRPMPRVGYEPTIPVTEHVY
jgi:hypothetical protein